LNTATYSEPGRKHTGRRQYEVSAVETPKSYQEK